MSNDEAFDLALIHFQEFYANSAEYRFIVDTKTSNVTCNSAYYNVWSNEKWAQVHHKDNINLFEFISDHPHKSDLIDMYEKVVKSKLAVTNLGINFLRKKDYVVMYFHYSPLVNTATQDVVAIQVVATKLNFPIAFFRLPALISRLSTDRLVANFDERLKDYDGFINNYEQEILFLIFYFDTYDDIASVISLKYAREIKGNTIAKYVRRNLYTKFNVISNRELKVAAIKRDYHKKIPLSLVSSMIIDLGEL